MSDTASNKFLGYGTNAERLAFTPSPATIASAPHQAYFWFTSDTLALYVYTTSWAAVGGGGGGTWGSITGTLSAQTDLATALGLKSPLASPTFTGTPAVPTAAPGTNTTQVASTAFIAAAIAALINSAPGALDTLEELADALGDDANFAATVTTLLAAKAPLASPALTGAPTAPTAAIATNTTQLATTAFVIANAGGGAPVGPNPYDNPPFI